ncbi:hypothetical protein [Bacteroides sp.]
MKTKAFKYLKPVLLVLLMVNLAACEVAIDGFYDDDHIGGGYYNKSRELCSRTWVRYYYNIDGYYCRQEIDFYLDRRGIDYIRVQYPNGRISEYEYRFVWNWENPAQSSLCMVYAPDDVSHLDEVRIWGNQLTGYLDGWNNYVIYNGR